MAHGLRIAALALLLPMGPAFAAPEYGGLVPIVDANGAFDAQAVPTTAERARIEARAAAGHPAAQFALGWIHYAGRGVAVDYERAARWMKPAAEANLVSAQTVMGDMYERGWGVEQDFGEAYALIAAAAKGGSEHAQARATRYACARTAECTIVHDVPLTVATRAIMRTAMRRIGAIAIREDSDYVREMYAAPWGEHPHEIRIAYVDDVLFRFEEQYPSLDALPDVFARLQLTLGKPASKEGEVAGDGKLEVTWKRPYGVAVTLHREAGASTFDVASDVLDAKAEYDAAYGSDSPATASTTDVAEAAGSSADATTAEPAAEKPPRPEHIGDGRTPYLLGATLPGNQPLEERRLDVEECAGTAPFDEHDLHDHPTWLHHVEPDGDGTYRVAIGYRDQAVERIVEATRVRPGRAVDATVTAPVVGGGPPEAMRIDLRLGNSLHCIDIAQFDQPVRTIAERIVAARGIELDGIELLSTTARSTLDLPSYDLLAVFTVLADAGDASLVAERIADDRYAIRKYEASADSGFASSTPTTEPPACLARSECTTVFGVPLVTASRAVMRRTLASLGVVALREDDGYARDRYVGIPAPWQHVLALDYDRDELVAVQEDYAAGVDLADVVRALTEAHGRPDERRGAVQGLGALEIAWHHGDGTTLTVAREAGASSFSVVTSIDERQARFAATLARSTAAASAAAKEAAAQPAVPITGPAAPATAVQRPAESIETGRTHFAVRVAAASPMLLGQRVLELSRCEAETPYGRGTLADFPGDDRLVSIEPLGDGRWRVAVATRDARSDHQFTAELRDGETKSIAVREPVPFGGPPEVVSMSLDVGTSRECIRVLVFDVSAREVARRVAAAGNVSIEGIDLVDADEKYDSIHFDSIAIESLLHSLADFSGVRLERLSPTRYAFRPASPPAD